MDKLGLLLSFTIFLVIHATGQSLMQSIKHPHTIYDVDMSSDEREIFTAGKDSVARIWHRKGELLLEFKEHGSSVSAIDYHENTKTILSSAYNGEAYLWNMHGQILANLAGHTDAVVDVLQHNEFLATASRDHTAAIWGRNGKIRLHLKGHQGQVNSIVYDKTRNVYLTGSRDKTIKVWNDTGKVLKTVSLSDEITAILQTDKNIIVGHRNGNLSILDLSYELALEIEAHQSRVNDIKSLNDKTFLTAGSDQSIKFWSLTGQLIAELTGHTSYVSGLAISGNRLASSSGGEDKTLKIWKIDPHLGLSYSCLNEGFLFLNQIIGSWNVKTKDRTSPGNYEDNQGNAEIYSTITGCGVSIEFKGWYRNNPYARNVQLVAIDSTNIQMLALDSEHGSYTTLNGQVTTNQMELIWYKNKEKKRLQSKYIMTIKSSNAFEFSSYLSTDYGKTWSLTHERKYTRM